MQQRAIYPGEVLQDEINELNVPHRNSPVRLDVLQTGSD